MLVYDWSRICKFLWKLTLCNVYKTIPLLFRWPPKLKNIDRSSARPVTVTYNGVSVVITDYQPLLRGPRSSSEHSPSPTLKGPKPVTPGARIESETVADSSAAVAAAAAAVASMDSKTATSSGSGSEAAPSSGSGESDVKRFSPESGKSNGTSSTVAMSDRDSDSDTEAEASK